MNRKCIGCGAVLQTADEAKAGFVPSLTSNLCKRCFRVMHYNELPKIVATNEEYENVIDSVVKKKALMIYIVDLFAFKSTFLSTMIDKLRSHDVILVANKVDLLPKSSNLNKVVDWMAKECQRQFFKVLAIGVSSAKKGYFMDDLISTIDLARKGRDVYFVGCANVGKSSLINALLKRTTQQSSDAIATSLVPGTTLNEIRIPYFIDNCALVDTPGLINPKDILNHLFPISYKKIVPNVEIKPITYQIHKETAIFLGGLAMLSFHTKEGISATFYTSRDLYLHRCKISRVNELFETQLGKLLTPPTQEELDSVKYTTKNFQLQGKKNLWFSGFGFIQIIGNCKIELKYIEQTEVYITDALFG